MSIKSTYNELLSHVGKTLSINDFLKSQFSVALRHDIDYDLDLALEFAHLEHSLGYKSTYFLLDTAGYWYDPKFDDKALQLQDFGHEVGLHVNSLAKWASGRCDNPETDFKANLTRLRDIGLVVSGIAAHGDPDCYNYNAANYWMFSELRPESPYLSENNITAEGIFDLSTSRTLVYPTNGKITNIHGDSLPLWQTSMSDNKIDYHASHIEYDQYFSDSGGSWRNNLNPMNFSFHNKRTQILIHPEHWKGEKKVFFFLSTARSGSKWLSEVLENGTSCAGAHEFTLNYEGPDSKNIKNTRTNFQEIQRKDDILEKLLLHSFEYISTQPYDWAECNVYLPHLIDKLKNVFQNATIIHLKRDTEKVVNSLINRNWYDTPDDQIHPLINFDHYAATSQVMRCVSYVEETKSNIEINSSKVLIQEKLVTDFEYFKTQMNDLGIAVYPRLANKYYYQKINKNKNETYILASDWTDEMKKDYAKAIQAFDSIPQKSRDRPRLKTIKLKSFDKRSLFFEYILSWFNLNKQFREFHSQNISLSAQQFSVSGSIINNCANSYFSIGGADWYKTSLNKGFSANKSFYYEGNIEIISMTEIQISVFCIFFKDGQQIGKRTLYVGQSNNHIVKFAFTLIPETESFDVFVYIPKKHKPLCFELKNFHLNGKKYV